MRLRPGWLRFAILRRPRCRCPSSSIRGTCLDSRARVLEWTTLVVTIIMTLLEAPPALFAPQTPALANGNKDMDTDMDRRLRGTNT